MQLGFKRQQFSSLRAKGLRQWKLRTDLYVSQQVDNSEPSYVIKLPGDTTYFRFGELEYEVLTLCDGSRTPLQIAAEMSQRHPQLRLDESQVIDFLDTADSTLWERTRAEKHLAFLERIRDERSLQIDHFSLLNIRFRPWNPDKVLGAVNRYCGWVFTRRFIFASVALFLATVWLLGTNWDQIVQDSEALYSFEGRFSYDVLTFWVILMALEAIHEFGHGLVCKHFGGEVPEVGFSLVYFTPSFYMDTTDMLLFNRRQRYWVIFAGVWCELVVCGLATLVWSFSMPGTYLNDFAYRALLLSGIETILWNLNPLIQADGYYALADYLGIDNLAENSQQFLWAWTQKHLLAQNLELPSYRARESHIFLAYGVAYIVNMLLLAAASLLFVKDFVLARFGTWPYLLLGALVLLFVIKRLKRLLGAGKDLVHHARGKLRNRRPSQGLKAVFIVLALLVFIPMFRSHVKSDFVLEPGKRIILRPKVDGRVSEIYVQEGDSVGAGQVLARMENPQIETDQKLLTDELSLVSSELRTNEYQYDSVLAARASQERTRLQSQLEVVEARQQSLEMTAPADGVIATPVLDQKQGEFLVAGEDFCQIVNRTTLRARILVHDWDFQDVKAGSAVTLKVEAFPFNTYTGTVEQILPAAAADQPITSLEKPQRLGQELTNYLALLVSVKNPGGLLEGMTGTAKISGGSHSLAWLAARSSWRWLRRHIF